MADECLVEFLHAEIVKYVIENNEKKVNTLALDWLENIDLNSMLIFFVLGGCIDFGVLGFHHRLQNHRKV